MFQPYLELGRVQLFFVPSVGQAAPSPLFLSPSSGPSVMSLPTSDNCHQLLWGGEVHGDSPSPLGGEALGVERETTERDLAAMRARTGNSRPIRQRLAAARTSRRIDRHTK